MTAQNNKGIALAFAILFLFLTVVTLDVLMQAATNGFAIANRSADLKRATYTADAGIADAFIQLRGYPSPPMSFNVSNANYALGSGKTGSYSVSVVGAGSPWVKYKSHLQELIIT